MFIEFGYFSAEILNMWILSDNDDLLYVFLSYISDDAVSAMFGEFYKTIKKEFPETIFHGIDVGHAYSSEGKFFLQYLKDNDKQDSEQYLLTLKAIKQGEHYHKTDDLAFRVTKMTENFIREFDKLNNQNVMGIFGAAHTAYGFMEALGLSDVPTMAQRLKERYGDSLHTEDLSRFAWVIDPIRVDIITITGVDYESSYFGTDLTRFGNIISRSFWRLENAYDDFSSKLTNEDWLPFNNYPMKIELNQVFFVDAVFTDSSVLRLFFRSDGECMQGLPVTTGFIVD
jgi:hypothetical protein